jgi:hypothetical protein
LTTFNPPIHTVAPSELWNWSLKIPWKSLPTTGVEGVGGGGCRIHPPTGSLPTSLLKNNCFLTKRKSSLG